MKKRLICALLVSAVAATALASCGGGETTASGGGETTAAAETTTEAVTEPEPISYLSAGLPEVDFDGYAFRFQQPTPTYTHPWWFIDAEEQTGEVLNDATYDRNRTIEDAYNIDIVVNFSKNDTEWLNDMQKMIAAGDDGFDTGYAPLGKTISLFLNEMLTDLWTVENLNPEGEWWDQAFVNDLTVNGRLYYIAGDLTPLMTLRAYSMVFNKDLADTLGVEYPYDAVREGQWTLEYFTKYVQGVNSDLNGDGVMDYEDRWGFFSENVASNMLFVSFGGRIVDKDADDHLFFAADTEKNLDRLNAALGLIIDKETTIWANPLVSANGGSWVAASEWFAQGNALVRSSTFENVPRDYRSMENDFGVVPFPKYDEAQESYLTNASETGYVISLPVTVTDTARAGHIIEALAAESVNTTTPALYDVCLEGKYIRDDESADMLDLIFDNKVYDWGYMFSIGGFRSKMTSLETSYSTDTASMIASIETQMATDIEKYMEIYTK